MNFYTEIQQVVWLFFIVGLIRYKYTAGLLYFNKTNFWSLLFIRLKRWQKKAFLNTPRHRKWLFDKSMILPSHHSLFVSIDLQTTCFEDFFKILLKTQKKISLWIKKNRILECSDTNGFCPSDTLLVKCSFLNILSWRVFFIFSWVWTK